MTTATRELISVWHDTTSDDHGWIVDHTDRDGSTTLAVCSTRIEALERAKSEARQRGLRLVEIDDRGLAVEVAL